MALEREKGEEGKREERRRGMLPEPAAMAERRRVVEEVSMAWVCGLVVVLVKMSSCHRNCHPMLSSWLPRSGAAG